MKKNLILALTMMAGCLLTACSNCEQRQGMKNPPKHVIIVGFDGLSSDCLNKGLDMPTYRKLMKEGAYTSKNRSVLPTSSAVNWASIYMGAGPELHGFTRWNTETPDLPSRELTKNGLFPDIYYMVRQVLPEAEMGFIYEWDGMKYVVDVKSIDFVKRQRLSDEDTMAALDTTVNYIKNKKPALCSVVFANPDNTGHQKGWGTEEYFAIAHHVDKGLNEIVKAVEEAGMMDETVFVLVADHGGKGQSHGGKSIEELETTVVYCGKGIKKGFVIPESTVVYDAAATIGYMFGIDQPQVWTGRPVMSIFE